MIDLFPSSGTIPTGYAKLSSSYFDGLLLRGGRITDTTEIAPGIKRNYAATGEFRDDVPPGKYRLCPKVDPGNFMDDVNEKNNLSCIPVRVRSPLPNITGMEPIKLVPPI